MGSERGPNSSRLPLDCVLLINRHPVIHMEMTHSSVFRFMRKVVRFTLLIVAVSGIVGFHGSLLAFNGPSYSVEERLEQFGPRVRARLAPWFKKINVAYPPRRVCLLGFKKEKTLEVWVSDGADRYVHLKNYLIWAASGSVGPKLRKGDQQVPEGFYRVEALNPNSQFHLALRINYPNEYDKKMARKDGRDNLGGDIMIHGSLISSGCLAMGDKTAEDLFVLSAETGIENVSVILSPVDFRVGADVHAMKHLPPWTADLYLALQIELRKLKPDWIHRVN